MIRVLLLVLLAAQAQALTLHRGHVVELLPNAQHQMERALKRWDQFLPHYACPYSAAPWELCANYRRHKITNTTEQLRWLAYRLDLVEASIAEGDLLALRAMVNQPFDGAPFSMLGQVQLIAYRGEVLRDDMPDAAQPALSDLQKATFRLWMALDRILWHINDGIQEGE